MGHEGVTLPMVVEAVMIAVLALGYRSFGADPRR